MKNKNTQKTETTVKYVAVAKTSYKDSYGDIAFKKGKECILKNFDKEKYKQTGTVNFVLPTYYAAWGGCRVYKNIPATVKKVTTKVTTITEVTEEEI